MKVKKKFKTPSNKSSLKIVFVGKQSTGKTQLLYEFISALRTKHIITSATKSSISGTKAAITFLTESKKNYIQKGAYITATQAESDTDIFSFKVNETFADGYFMNIAGEIFDGLKSEDWKVISNYFDDLDEKVFNEFRDTIYGISTNPLETNFNNTIKYENGRFEFNTVEVGWAVAKALVLIYEATDIIYCWDSSYEDDEDDSFDRISAFSNDCNEIHVLTKIDKFFKNDDDAKRYIKQILNNKSGDEILLLYQEFWDLYNDSTINCNIFNIENQIKIQRLKNLIENVIIERHNENNKRRLYPFFESSIGNPISNFFLTSINLNMTNGNIIQMVSDVTQLNENEELAEKLKEEMNFRKSIGVDEVVFSVLSHHNLNINSKLNKHYKFLVQNKKH